MARKTSTRSGASKTSEPAEEVAEAVEAATEDATTTDPAETAGDTGEGDTTDAIEAASDGSETPDDPEATTETPPENTDDSADADAPQDDTAEAAASDDTAEPTFAPAETPPAPAVERVVERQGPGFFPLLLGGVIAALIGYGLAVSGLLPGPSGQDNDAAIEALSTSLDTQGATLATLSEQTSAIEAALADLPEVPDIPEVDLSPLEAQIGEIGGAIDALTERVAALEERPLLTGEGGDAEAAMAAAMAQLQAQLQDQQDANAAMADEVRTLAEEAEARIAEAEARAEARAGTAAAQAAVSELRIAVAAGNPFSEPLAEVAQNAGIDIPEGLTAVAETGVPTLEELQASYPTAARSALPIALRETAGEGAMDRVGAFIRGQVGGRSLEPREGNDPDAVLSRAEAAVASGDLQGALGEIGALPDAAQEAMAAWVATAETRLAATEALDAFSAALDGAN